MALSVVSLSAEERLRFVGRFVGAAFGEAMVLGSAGEIRYDRDEPYLLLNLTLGTPPADQDTWSVEDLFGLRQEVRKRLRESGVHDVEISYVGGASAADPHDEQSEPRNEMLDS